VKPLSECRLYTFADTGYLHGRNIVETTRQLCDGGSDLIQLRAKDCSLDEIKRMAETILPVTERAGVGLVINDHAAIALQIGAPLCHLGQEDFFDAGFTQAAQVTGCPPQMKLGLSTHAPVQAQRALRAGADYVAIGPVYATGTKPTAPPVTLDYVRWATANVKIPWFAIGGIDLRNLDDVLAAGATRVCVVSAILNATNIAKACSDFKERLLSPRDNKSGITSHESISP
jgi:thiamine-phosphate pyrophosphorylase